MDIRIIFKLLTAIALLLMAAWLAYPSRNIHGNPHMEELVQSCTTPNNIIVRLYTGNGGATTAFWYTVTTSKGFLSREKQIIFSYSSPVLSSISCVMDIVTITSSSGNIILTGSELTTLRNNPVSYWRGKTKESESWPISEVLSLIFATMSGLAGISLLLSCYKNNRVKINQKRSNKTVKQTG